MSGEPTDRTDAHDVPRRIGIGIALTTDPRVTRGLLQSLCLALTNATGVEVVPRGVSSYGRLVDQLHRGELDFVWLPPLLALRATLRDQVVPIALPIRNGESCHHAALFCRADSRHRSIEDLHHLRAAWVDPESAAGYLIIRAHLRTLGVDLEEAFVDNTFCGSHAAVTDAVDSGRADVGATFAYLEGGSGAPVSSHPSMVARAEAVRPRRAGWGSKEMRLVASAGPIPNDVIAARKGVSSILVRLMQSALVDVHNAQLREAARVLLTAEGFEVPTADHFNSLRHLLEGMDTKKPVPTATPSDDDTLATPHSMFPPLLDP